MPFRVASVMDQKPVFVEFAAAEGPNVGELCRRFGISSTTGYKLLPALWERGAESGRPGARALLYAAAAVQEITSTASGSVRIQELDGSPTGRGCGRAHSSAKLAAARQNGRKGGRRASSHRYLAKRSMIERPTVCPLIQHTRETSAPVPFRNDQAACR